MTEQQMKELDNYRNQVTQRCPDCEGISIEFIFNLLDYSNPYNFTIRCRSCGYKMEDDDPKRLISKWNRHQS